MAFAAISLLALVAGALIGIVGIGGVLLVPALSLIGVPVHAAVAAALAAYVLSGGVAALVYARSGAIAWRSALWLGLGAAPGAGLGAALAHRAGSAVLTALIALGVLFAGARALARGRRAAAAERRLPAPPALLAIGAAIGIGSALTGTSGPVLLMPPLIWLDVPLLTAIGLAQAIQVPIALVATAANLAFGLVDPVLASLLGAGTLVGAFLGARAAHGLPVAALTRLVGGVLLAVGALLLARLVLG